MTAPDGYRVLAADNKVVDGTGKAVAEDWLTGCGPR